MILYIIMAIVNFILYVYTIYNKNYTMAIMSLITGFAMLILTNIENNNDKIDSIKELIIKQNNKEK